MRQHDLGFALVEGTITFLREGVLKERALNPLLHTMKPRSTEGAGQ